jgi:hypothetical protein
VATLEVELALAPPELVEKISIHDVFEDLCANERLALALSPEGVLTVWDVDGRAPVAILADDGQLESARFVGPSSSEIVAGTASGEIVFFAVER